MLRARSVFTHIRHGSRLMRCTNNSRIAWMSSDSKGEDEEQKDHKVLVDMMSQLRIDTQTGRYDEGKSQSVDFSAQLANKKWNDPAQRVELRHEELQELFKMAKAEPPEKILERHPGLQKEQLEKLLKHYSLPVVAQ